MSAENIIKITASKLIPPIVSPSKHPAEGACSQLKIPSNKIKVANASEE